MNRYEQGNKGVDHVDDSGKHLQYEMVLRLGNNRSDRQDEGLCWDGTILYGARRNESSRFC